MSYIVYDYLVCSPNDSLLEVDPLVWAQEEDIDETELRVCKRQECIRTEIAHQVDARLAFVWDWTDPRCCVGRTDWIVLSGGFEINWMTSRE